MGEASPVAAATEARRSQRLAALGRMLAHPLLLLLIGASISALLVPMLTQRWQDHQRALDVQTTLVADITDTSERFLQTMGIDQSALSDPECQGCPGQITPAKAIAELNSSARRFGVRWAVIRSRLRAYYPGRPIISAWDRLNRELDALYRGANPDLARFESRLLSNVLKTRVDLVHDYLRAWTQVGSYRDEIVQQILDTRPRV